MLWLSCPVSPTRDVGVLCQVPLPAPYATGDKIWFERKTRALLHELLSYFTTSYCHGSNWRAASPLSLARVGESQM